MDRKFQNARWDQKMQEILDLIRILVPLFACTDPNPNPDPILNPYPTLAYPALPYPLCVDGKCRGHHLCEAGGSAKDSSKLDSFHFGGCPIPKVSKQRYLRY